MKRLCIILLVLSAALPAMAQQKLSAAGRDFWMAFMENTNSDALTLYITSAKGARVQVSIPLQGYARSKTIAANSTDTFILPNSLANNYNSGIKRKTGIHITSDEDVNVYALNLQSSTTDASTILPTTALGKDVSYIVSSFEPEATSFSELIVVAVEDNSVIEVVPSARTRDGWTAGSLIHLYLNKGETYQLQGDLGKFDLTGTTVRSINGCKTFAVFQGATCANVLKGQPACDHLFQQCYPIHTLGTEYLTTPFIDQKGYVVRLLAVQDSTVFKRDNAPLFLIAKKGQYKDVVVDAEDCILFTGDKPFYCTQLMKSNSVNGASVKGYGDPSQLSLSPLQQSVNRTVLSTVSSVNLKNHYLNIVVKSSAVSKVLLDNAVPPLGSFTVVPARPSYSYVRLTVSNGTHTIVCDSGFIAVCYGVGPSESYAYMVGASFENVNKNFTISYSKVCDSVFVSGFADTIKQFRWLWGDGGSDTGITARHSYTAPGNYTISMILQSQSACGGADTLRKTIAFFPVNKPSLGRDTASCTDIALRLTAGTTDYTYVWNDNSADTFLNVTQPGTYTVLKRNDAGCSSADTIIITDHSIKPNRILPDDSTQCLKGNRLLFRLANNIFPDSAIRVHWDFGDGLSADSVQSDTVVYASAGNKQISACIYNIFGCRDTAFTLAKIYPQPGVSQQVNDTVQCLDGHKFIFSNYYNALATYYSWDFGDGQSIMRELLQGTDMPELQHIYKDSGLYKTRLITESVDGCTDTLYSLLRVLPSPELNFGATFSDTGLQSTAVRVKDNTADVTSRLWLFGNMARAYGADTTLIVDTDRDSITVYLSVSNRYGCSTAKRSILDIVREFKAFVPTAFSPNSDHVNDVFNVTASRLIKGYRCDIYNRWGELIYSTDNIQQGWDGTCMNAEAEQDVYMYHVFFRDYFDKEYILSGTFHLIR